MQWGVDRGRANSKQINYPIAFVKFAKVVALDGFNSKRLNCYSSLYEEPSLTYFKFNYDSETNFVNWIAIGVQQWGLADSNVANRSITYPITIATPLAFMATLVRHDSQQNWWGVQATGSVEASTLKPCVYTSYAKIWNEHNTAVFWALIAKQQWGFLRHEQGDIWYTVNFPVSFSAQVIGVCGSVVCITSAESAVTSTTWKISSTTLASFVCALRGSNANWGTFWIAIGIQTQWGYSVATGNALRTISFPIVFSNQPFSIVLTEFGTIVGHNLEVRSKSKNNFVMWLQDGGRSAFWLAIGYQRSGELKP